MTGAILLNLRGQENRWIYSMHLKRDLGGKSREIRILKLLKNKKINNRTSVKDALLQLSKIYLTDVGERTMMTEIPKKVRELTELLELKPELSPKKVPS